MKSYSGVNAWLALVDVFGSAAAASPGSASPGKRPTRPWRDPGHRQDQQFHGCCLLRQLGGARPWMSPRHISSLLTNLYTFRDIAN
jgi:hypothetical protein